ncbi:unnamed protein product [Linum trigynum]|uniref:Syntaxin N-terminal domain-containing protein n=1 Tax=Linum trigynum TaxID=586398 RepID=A0AAV2CHB8_9ROSI
MNELFFDSFSCFRNDEAASLGHHVGQLSEIPSTTGSESIKDELKELDKLNSTLHNTREAKDLLAQMDANVSTALKKAKLIKVRQESLNGSNTASQSVPDCGLESSSDQIRTFVVNEL